MPERSRGDAGSASAGILFGGLTPAREEVERDERSNVACSEYERIIGAATERFGALSGTLRIDGAGFVVAFSTAHCVVECGLAIRQEFLRRGWPLCLGGHYGEIQRSDSGEVVGENVSRAQHISAAAEAGRGQFLVSDVVCSMVQKRLPDNRFEPHGTIEAAGGEAALTIAEVVPGDEHDGRRAVEVAGDMPTRSLEVRAAKPPSRPARWVIGSVALAVVLASVAVMYFRAKDGWLWHTAAPTLTGLPASANTIAVMEFENQRLDDARNDWYAKALQTAFNTELSKLPQLNVVAPEIIQHAAREAGLDRMAAARQLGVSRFVTGSFAVLGNTIRIDARIVETVNGFQEAAENVEGIQDEFFSLQKQLAFVTLEHFRVRLTAEQEASLKKTTNSRLDKYRMLLDVEGVTAQAPGDPQPGDRGTPSTDAPPASGDDRRSWLVPLLAPWGIAHAQVPAPPAETEARQVLEEYRRAHEQGDLDGLASLYVSFSPSQRKKIGAYLADAAQLQVELVDVLIQPRGDALAVSYTRRDRFVDKESGEPVYLEVRVTKFMVRDGGVWKFADGS